MTTPIDEEAEIRRLERETEGLKMLTAQQDAKNEARMAKILKAPPPVEKDETKRHLNELRGGIEYPQETDSQMREKGRADYNAAYLNVPGAFAWIILCAAPGCRNKSEHFDHHALSRQFTGPLCNEHNTSGKRARDQFGPEHFVKMAENAEAHLRVRGDAIAVSDRAGDDPKPIGPGGGHY